MDDEVMYPLQNYEIFTVVTNICAKKCKLNFLSLLQLVYICLCLCGVKYSLYKLFSGFIAAADNVKAGCGIVNLLSLEVVVDGSRIVVVVG